MDASKKEDMDKLNICLAHFSNYCNWNSYDNYLYAKQYAGLQTLNKNSVGTYNNFAQTDSLLYVLHTYFMYLKFGFGRCAQDVCRDIRLGRISRNEGIELIIELDEKYPKEYEEAFLDYYDMTKKEFHAVIDTFANKEILEKRDGLWRKKKDFVKEYLKKE